MEKLDLKMIIECVRQLNNSAPVTVSGVSDHERTIEPSELAGAIVGAALGCHCPIPPRRVPMATGYFATTHATEVRNVLSQINEAVTIRTQIAYDAAVSIWVDRYDMVHRPCSLNSLIQRLCEVQPGEFSNVNHIRPLIGNMNSEQRTALEKIVKSVNLSCSKVEEPASIFDQ